MTTGSSAVQVEVGSLLGGCYRVLEPLGEGGMASVYRGVHIVTGQGVALKVLRTPARPEQRAEMVQLFEREFMTLAQVSHPRVVAGYDYGVDPIVGPFYAMEMLDGGDLHQRTPLPWREACSIARDVCAALSLLHSRRLVYRDLSPRNVRCTSSGVAKLIDFGAMTPFGVPNETVGTPPFVAPETLAAGSLDGRTDLYALGATLYFALTGHHAYPARAMVQLWELWRTLPVPPSSYVSDIPEGLDRLVMQLLQHDPVQRPTDAAEVMQRLEALAGLPADEQLHVGHAYLVAPKLVGREKELRKLRDVRSAVANGRTSVVLLTGPHGIGRSRLLQESSLQAKVQGFVSVMVSGRDAQEGEYGLFRALAEQLLCALPALARDALPGDSAALAEIIPQLEQSSAELPRVTLPESQRRARIQAAACAWLAAIARHVPLCLLIDDAPRADVPSLALLANLPREHGTAPIAVLWSASSDERAAADWPVALVLLERISSIVALPALGPSETEELLAGVFGDVPNLAQLSSYVQHTSAGNPRDALQLVQHLVSEGIVTHQAGAWSLPARWTGAGLPSSIVHALEQRVSKLGASARLLAYAFAAEPKERFSGDECALLLDGVEAADRTRDLRQCRDAGVVERVGSTYRLAQLGFAGALAHTTTPADQAGQHRRLARVYRQREDGFRASQHLLRAGDQVEGLELLLATSTASERRTDADARVYFEEMRALPAEWLALFEDGVRLCETMKRPLADRDILLGRASGFIAVASTARSGAGLALLRQRLARLIQDTGLDLYAAMPESMTPEARLKAALAQATQRYEGKPTNERVFQPLQAIRPFASTLLCALGVTSVSNDVRAQRALPQLGPLTSLSPALWVAQQTIDGVGARLEGRLEAAARIYQGILERMSAGDRAGLQEAQHRTTALRIMLSLGTLEACMGLPRALEKAASIASELDYETEGLMLRHLGELWLGRLGEAASTRQAIERRRALGVVDNNFGSQYLLAELAAQGLLNDLAGLRQSAEAAKRIADQHPSWNVVVQYCQGEYEFNRGDMNAALERLEQALREMGGPREHQLWPNAAAAQIRVLVELGRHEQARTLGEGYLAQAEAADLGYLANYLRMALSQALAPTDIAAATELADRAINEFQALGSGGLNLVLALENRARIALIARDQPTYERITALSNAESPVLARRLRRVAAGSAGPRDSIPNDGATSILLTELSSALNGSSEMGERSRGALRILNRHAGARGAVCYVRGTVGLERIGSAGELPHLDQLDRWAQAYFDGQVMAHEVSTSVFDALTEIVPNAYGIPGGMYVPRVIGHAGADGYVHTGLLVLYMPMAANAGWMTVFTETLSRSLAVSA